jgi:hypothetical protein
MSIQTAPLDFPLAKDYNQGDTTLFEVIREIDKRIAIAFCNPKDLNISIRLDVPLEAEYYRKLHPHYRSKGWIMQADPEPESYWSPVQNLTCTPIASEYFHPENLSGSKYMEALYMKYLNDVAELIIQENKARTKDSNQATAFKATYVPIGLSKYGRVYAEFRRRIERYGWMTEAVDDTLVITMKN